jgi:hypothetical protein
MKIPTCTLPNSKDVNRQRERENESRRLEELMKRLQTMIREGEQSIAQKAA